MRVSVPTTLGPWWLALGAKGGPRANHQGGKTFRAIFARARTPFRLLRTGRSAKESLCALQPLCEARSTKHQANPFVPNKTLKTQYQYKNRVFSSYSVECALDFLGSLPKKATL